MDFVRVVHLKTKTRFVIWIILLVFLSYGISTVSANNIKVNNGVLVSQNTSAKTINIQFDLSWDNSWRDAVNYDAAWIFIKYSTDSGTTLGHATFRSSGVNPTGYFRGSGTQIDIVVPVDDRGCFIQRVTQASGTTNVTGIQVVWDYGTDGVSDADVNGTSTLIKIFAIEMSYIPQGGFNVGDGSDGTQGEFEFGKTSNVAPAISSESGISFTNETANAWYYNSDSTAEDDSNGTAFDLNASFPKGYHDFYLMKYELTQAQYAEFLNTLTAVQAGKRFPNQNGNDRHTIGGSYPHYSASRPDRACNYLSWMDVLAYADWAGLRPMTEFEFEKACRGTLSPKIGEYAYGTTTIALATTISGSEDGTEKITNVSANAHYGNTLLSGGDGGKGPLRAGIFATSSSGRSQAGAGYYSNLDLSGDLWERVVTVGNSSGRSFSGTHGDGKLTALAGYEGNATNMDWPGIDDVETARGITGAKGAGFRGGAWDETNNSYLRISNRFFAAHEDTARRSDSGGRLARTAP